jgi:hypothetical protein
MAGDAQFTAARKDRNKKMKIEIDWYPSDDNDETATEVFWCYPGRVPGGLMFDVIRIGPGGSVPFWQFWSSIMDEPEYERWFNFTHEPGRIDDDTIRKVMDKVIEFDAARPTTPSSS